MNTAEVLDKIADEFDKNPGSWTRGAFARTAHDSSVAPTSESAVCWCAVGAIRRELNVGLGMNWNPLTEPFNALFMALEIPVGPTRNSDRIAEWNDNPSREVREVVELFRKAAKEARKS